jgi:threonine dehydrogenase-like Zn-dependent dehydrogenase
MLPATVRIENVPDPSIVEPTDAVLRVTRACICGSDLWPYASMEPSESGQSMGHEAIGIVEDVGAEVRTLKRGDRVVMPFAISDGTCDFCHEGLQTECVHVAFFGNNGMNGAQAEALPIPYADGTLFKLPVGEDDALMPSLLTLADVLGTGHHAAVVAKVAPGKSVAVVGDGAVGLCGVIASKRLGAEQIIIMGRHTDRIALAREFGATDVVRERGPEAVERVTELTRGFGPHSVLECVGLAGSTETAISIAGPGGAVGRVGVPQNDAMPSSRSAFSGTSQLAGDPPPYAPTSMSCCPTSSRAGSSSGRCSTGRSTWTACRTDTARWPSASQSKSWCGHDWLEHTRLERIASADELEVAAARRDRTLRRATLIWVVRVGDDVYVRSWRGSDGVWFRAARARGHGHITAGGVERNVAFVEAEDEVWNCPGIGQPQPHNRPARRTTSRTSNQRRES